jgi:MFS family permease
MKSNVLSIVSHNVHTYILDYVVSYFYIPIAVWPLLFAQYLTFSELGTILMVGMIVNMILNIPTGALADRFGRKTMILVSYTFAFVSRVMIVFAFNFWMFLFSEIMKQAAEAFYSGSAVALVYDSLRKEKREQEFKSVESRGYFFASIGFIGASILGGYLYGLHPRAPFVAMLIIETLMIINALRYVEDRETNIVRKERYLDTLKNGVRHIFRHRQIAIVSLYSLVISFVFFSAMWLLYQKSANEFGYSSIAVGYLIAVLYLFRAGGTFVYAKMLSHVSDRTMGIGLALLQALGSFFVAVIHVPIALFGLGTRYFTDGLRQPFLTKIQNEHIESKYRSTSLSAISFLTSFALALASPLLGFGIDRIGARATLALTGILSLTMGTYLGSLITEKKIEAKP